MKIKVSIILAIICLAGAAFGMFYLWPDRESLNIVHQTSGNDDIGPEREVQSSGVHDVFPDSDLDAQEILNVNHVPVAVLEDGVAGLNYPEGTVGWMYRVPGNEANVEITTDSLVSITHSVPGRWFRDQTREVILETETGEMISREDFSPGNEIAPEIASGDVRVFFDDDLKGQLRSSDDDDYIWQLEPASWCSENSDPEVEAAGNSTGTYLAVDCAGGEGHLVQFDPLTGEVQWQQEFVPADGAPELLVIRNEVRSGKERDPTLQALDGQYRNNHRYVSQVDGESVFPTEIIDPVLDILPNDDISVPSTDPETPIQAFIIGSRNTVESHVFSNIMQRLIDWSLIDPNDLDSDAFKDPKSHEFHEPLSRLYYHDQQRLRLRGEIEEFTAEESRSS